MSNEEEHDGGTIQLKTSRIKIHVNEAFTNQSVFAIGCG